MLDIGISKKDRKVIADSLSCLLSDSFIMYIKLQGCTWNMKGENAYNFQVLFTDQGSELLQGLHKIAYRIRSLDYIVPSSFKEYMHYSGLNEIKQGTHETIDIIKMLILDHEFLVRRAADVYDIANTINDPVTRSLVQERMRIHSENAWKMRMHIE